MTELPRRAVARTARLAALPLGYAGRTAMGMGRRIGGAPAETVLTEVQQRTAEQLFKTLGELKGGAMKMGQALSILESVLPEEVAAPYREQLTRLQDSAPPMSASTVRSVLNSELGRHWRDYELEAEAQAAFAAEFAGDPEVRVPDVVAHTKKVLVSEWVESHSSLARLIAEGTQEQRNHYGEQYIRFLFAGPARVGMLHADPHPGNFRVLPTPDGLLGGLGIVDFGAVARLPERSLPHSIGSLLRIASYDDYDDVLEGLRDEGFVKPNIRVDPDELREYLSPFVEPARTETFAFSREWMRAQFQRLQDPRQPGSTLVLRLNLPPSYLLIHRVWVGSIGVLSQLEAELPFRAILEESLPGFAEA